MNFDKVFKDEFAKVKEQHFSHINSNYAEDYNGYYEIILKTVSENLDAKFSKEDVLKLRFHSFKLEMPYLTMALYIVNILLSKKLRVLSSMVEQGT